MEFDVKHLKSLLVPVALMILARTAFAQAAAPAAAEDHRPFNVQTVPEEERSAIRLKNICSLKCEDENAITGIGLVVGLNGSGDSDQYLKSRTIQKFLNQFTGFEEFPSNAIKSKNAAVVVVTATMPSNTPRGRKLDVTVTAFGDAKSLEGGQLLSTVLVGNNKLDYAVAQGRLIVDNPDLATRARGQKIADVIREAPIRYLDDEYSFILVIDEDHASWTNATLIAKQIQNQYGAELPLDENGRIRGPKVLSRNQVRVFVSQKFWGNNETAHFIEKVLYLGLNLVDTEGKVYINYRDRSITITGNIRVESSLVSVDGLRISPQQTAAGAAVVNANPDQQGFGTVPIPYRSTFNVSLKNLMDDLNKVGASFDQQVKILRALKKSGALAAKFIEEEV